MDTDLAGFIALGALILGLFAWLRQDIRALRAEMNALREDMTGKIGALREEMDGKIGALREDMTGKIGALNGKIDALREDMTGKIDALREETNGKIGALNGKIDALRDEVGELRERVARIEGLLEAVFMRRDLTPVPEPPPSGTPDRSEAA